MEKIMMSNIRNTSLEERSLHQIQSARQNESSAEEQNRCSNAGRIAGIIAIIAVAAFAVIMTCVFAPVAAAILLSVVIIGVAIGLTCAVDSYSRGVIFVDRGPSHISVWPRRRHVTVVPTPVIVAPRRPVVLPLFPRAVPVAPVLPRPVHPILPRPIISAPVLPRAYSAPVRPVAPAVFRPAVMPAPRVGFGSAGLAPRVGFNAAVGHGYSPHRVRQ
jgi:hypothetical protein